MRRAVVDQAGMRVMLVGIVLALFLGLILKSQIRSSIVKARLQQSLLKLQKDVNIDFETVEVRLSEWGLPRPVVEIRGVRIRPLKLNCQENQIYIEAISFPLNFNLLFSKEKIISTARISLLEVRTKNTRYCFKEDSPSNNLAAIAVNTQKSVNENLEVNKESATETETEKNKFLQKVQSFKSQLNELKIDRLRLISSDKMNTAVDFNAVSISFKYKDNKLSEFNLLGQILAFKESQKSYYLLKSDLKFNLQVSDTLAVNAELKGMVIDRPFHLKIKNDFEKNNLQLFGELSGISLKAINYILKSENNNIEVYDFLSGSSMTGFITGLYDLDSRKYDFNIKNIRILLGGGLAEIKDIDISGQSDEKAKIKPFEIQLSHIDLTKILLMRVFDNIRSSIQNAGSISGLVQYIDVDKFKVKSLIENTNFVFSNRGERTTQVFDSFNLHADVNPQKISINLNEFILDSQKIRGEIKYTDFYKSGGKSILVNLEGRLLKSETVKIFTGHESEPHINLNFSSDFVKNLKGNILFSNLKIHQFDLSDVYLNYENNLVTKYESFDLKTSRAILSYSDNSAMNQLNKLFEHVFQKPQISFSHSRITVLKDSLGTLKFNVKADASNKSNFKLEGIYQPVDSLNSIGSFKNSNFKLSGQIDNLQFEAVK